MRNQQHDAERLVFRAIGSAPRASGPEAQELPRLDLVGAAIARAARLAAAETRARAARSRYGQTQAAQLLAALEAHAEAEEGRLLDLCVAAPAVDAQVADESTASTRRFVWRLHRAPAPAGAALAEAATGANA